MKKDRVSLEIAIADATFACHELNKAASSDKDGGFASTAKIGRLLREIRLMVKGQSAPGRGFADVDLEASYEAAYAGETRLIEIVASHAK
jgi:hypothetical protein